VLNAIIRFALHNRVLVLAAGRPGKEILYPVARVVRGGLTTSTFLDFCLTPTVFLRSGRKASGRIVAQWKASRAPEALAIAGDSSAVSGDGKRENVNIGTRPSEVPANV
jgi:hypothetical protein